MPERATIRGRRRTTPTKGDQRERAILDAAEEQLDTIGFDRMTIETITKAVGIARGAFYFYFASKNAVLAALVERTVATLRTRIAAADASGEPAPALRRSIDQTRDMWRDHGSVMRAAVELAPTVAAIDENWHSAVAAIRDITTAIAERAGLPDGDGPTGAHAVTTALVWMTERAFYQASKTGRSLDDTAATLTHLWLNALSLAPDPRPQTKSG
ncbi:TetR/AcrR family transcriptional regulator [Nocardia alni]|uniref:TetR/AcrR family transcriptional regulator n=1 Tax=Nocardia alni TaxID=2815723 RepID=UPI001C245962|nr:TetR/AcrR family transcriptional regulator [Nocardia alni]